MGTLDRRSCIQTKPANGIRAHNTFILRQSAMYFFRLLKCYEDLRTWMFLGGFRKLCEAFRHGGQISSTFQIPKKFHASERALLKLPSISLSLPPFMIVLQLFPERRRLQSNHQSPQFQKSSSMKLNSYSSDSLERPYQEALMGSQVAMACDTMVRMHHVVAMYWHIMLFVS